MEINWSKRMTLVRKCTNCGQPLTKEKLRVTFPLIPHLLGDGHVLNIEVLSSKNLEARIKPCTKANNARHTFDDQDYLTVS